MKPHTSTLFFLLASSLFIRNAYALNNPDTEWAIGLHAGYSFSRVAFVPKVEQPFTPGWRTGLSFRHTTGKHLGLVTELSLHSHNFSYLELPFLTHITFGNRFRGYLNLGPQLAYLLRNKTHLNVANRLDWGLCGGPGIELDLSFIRVLLETRYYYALGNLLSSRKQDPFSQSSLRTFSLNLILLLPQRPSLSLQGISPP
ncbi:MAG: PorT family protein [Tannerellaceae bacterium]|jgi:hypothetical protein|nr:PorT family protein [Tannerellaceae bacterium]